MNNKKIKEIEETLQNKNLKRYCIGKLLYTAKGLFSDISQFRDWIINLKYKEEIHGSESIFLSNVEEKIDEYLKHQYIIKEKKKFTDTEVNEEQTEKFCEKQELNNTRLEILTDIEKEIIFIGQLLTSPAEIQEYILKIDNDFFNVKQVQAIYNIIKNNQRYNLFELLIESGQTAVDLKCILKITENCKTSINENYSILSRYRVLRRYAISSDQEEVQKLLFEIPSYKKFQEFSIDGLEAYLKDILYYSNDRDNGGYKFTKNYKQVPFPVDFSDNYTEMLKNLNEELIDGIDSPFKIINKCIFGLRLGQFIGIGMLSNSGKTRFIANLFTYLVFVQNKTVLAILNETTIEDITMCIITTVINSTEIQEKYGFGINLKEKEIRKSINTKNKNSENTQQITNIINAITQHINNNLYIQITNDYTDLTLKNMIIQNHIKNGVDYIFYDTLKVSQESTNTTEDLKKTATMLSELAKQYGLFIASTFQLTEDTLKVRPSQISRLNIASSKQIYHTFDVVLLFKEISTEYYSNYNYIKYNEDSIIPLNKDKKYYLCNIDKNRNGTKIKLIFEVDLDFNIWKELGMLDEF